ncbi:MAG: nucleotide pyrophosphohydrolase [Deltaproteobacteria bacterium]|nr:nucleotide pyrophosphohydrolase [Deltaproteobacteria bacterium]
MSDIKRLTEKIRMFRDERNWKQFHNHKDMALSLVLEATEVLEHFQWKSEEEVNTHAETCKREISEELADVAIYLFELADNLNVDLADAVDKKLEVNTKKYPVEKAKGKHTKYDKF